ncbi:MAG: zinc-binding dehydrogenase [Planctomycetota bacterium]
MKALVVREHGGLERLVFEERPTPEPGPGEVRVAVRAVGVNHLDTWVRRGVPGHKFPLPLVLGSDAAGVVDAVGSRVESVAEGDEVVLLPGVSCGACEACLDGDDNLCRSYAILGEGRDGACAQFVVVPAANVAPKPKRLDFVQAACVPLVFQTADAMLRKARLREGDVVLVHAAGSGVGSAAIQLAKMRGATVLTTAGGPDKCEAALQLGADVAIDYRNEDFAARVREHTGKRGVDVVFEHVGQATFPGSVKCLARGGRLVTCGATTGGQVEISLHQVFFKNLEIIGNTMGRKGDLRRLLRVFDQGRLRPVLDRVLVLSQVAEAHRLLEERQTFGKVVLEP